MKSLSAALQAHLDSGTTTLAWCWRIERADGVVFGFTDHDRPLEFGGVTYEPESGFAASEIRSGTDLAVDAQEAEGVLTSDTITETDILDGRWDNAAVEVWRVNWSAVGQRVLMRRGAIGQVRRGRLAFVAEVRSLAHLLNQTVGRTFQHACDAELGDARCGVDLDDPAYQGRGLGHRADRRPQLHRLRARRLRGRLVHPRPADLDQRRERRPGRRGREPRRRRRRSAARAARGAGAADRRRRRLRRPRRLRQAAGDLPRPLRQRRELPRLPAHPRPGHGDPLPEPRRRQQRETCCDEPPIRQLVIAAARGWLGTPYHDQASVKGVGCDCLGLVRGVWRELYGAEPLPLPPYSRDWGETGTREPLAEAARQVMLEIAGDATSTPGALILFRMRTGAVAKHCGIVTAPDRFIHAYERTGVVEVPLDHAWRRRIAFAFLFPNPS